jgi:hypothetical protein
MTEGTPDKVDIGVYWREQFRSTLATVLSEQSDWVRKATHTQSSPESRILVKCRTEDAASRQPFTAAIERDGNIFLHVWYLMTLVDQTVFNHFREHRARWSKETEWHALPVFCHHNRCPHVLAPAKLLKVKVGRGPKRDRWDQLFQEILCHQLLFRLERTIGITKQEFSSALESEPAFGESPFEKALMQYLLTEPIEAEEEPVRQGDLFPSD